MLIEIFSFKTTFILLQSAVLTNLRGASDLLLAMADFSTLSKISEVSALGLIVHRNSSILLSAGELTIKEWSNKMAVKKVKINRAPVLTLWATVVAERLGYAADAALTLGKAVAGLNAQSKGRRLGIFEESEEKEEEHKEKKRKPGEELRVKVLGRLVPAVQTEQGIRATTKGQPLDPQSVKRYLKNKFGENLDDVQTAMEALAKAYKPKKLEAQAYALYEKFRPEIPEGKRGWGAAGELDLAQIRALAKQKK